MNPIPKNTKLEFFLRSGDRYFCPQLGILFPVEAADEVRESVAATGWPPARLIPGGR